MSDKKISQLSSATTPLTGTEFVPIVQSSTTVKTTVNEFATFSEKNLQQVLAKGNTAQNSIILTASSAAHDLRLINQDSFAGDEPSIYVRVNNNGAYHRITQNKVLLGSGSTGLAIEVKRPDVLTNSVVLTYPQHSSGEFVTNPFTGSLNIQNSLAVRNTAGTNNFDFNTQDSNVSNGPALYITSGSNTGYNRVSIEGMQIAANGNSITIVRPSTLTVNSNLTYPTASGTLAVVGTTTGLMLGTTQPSNPVTGSIYWDPTGVKLKVWNGTWLDMN